MLVEIEQQSPAWHDLRAKSIGSSDAAVILGVSPWRTIRELWLEKTGKGKPQKQNSSMARGNKLEPVARAHFEFRIEHDYPPVVMVSDAYPFIIASLDGFCEETNSICEIKCSGNADHSAALRGEVRDRKSVV